MIPKAVAVYFLLLPSVLHATEYTKIVGAKLPSFNAATITSTANSPQLNVNGLPSHDRLGRIELGLSEDLSSGSLTTRGSADVKTFNQFSSSVVLILASEGSGSGSVIDTDGHVLTNWHVVGSEATVDVIYRPVDVSQEAYGERTYAARVVKIDQVSDLALIKIVAPKQSIKPLSLATTSPVIGEDVSAIGHPLGFSWSYTRGIVTGVRSDHSWQYETGFQHAAKVVQTQTPINPGNSGGPLLNQNGEIIGVNSFKSGGEAINFAVSTDSVREFLDRSGSRYAPRIPGTPAMAELTADCEPTALGESWVSEDGQYVLTGVDISCDGEMDAILAEPLFDGVKKFEFDTNKDGHVDLTMIDGDNDGAWDLSFYDVNADGEADVVGYHSQESGAAPVEFSSFKKFQAMISS